MTKSADGEYFDGLGVTMYEGKFNGAFEMAEELGEKMRYNDVHSFLVTVVCGSGTFDENKKTGEIKRINKLNVVAVKDIDATAASQIDTILNGAVQQVPAPAAVQGVFAGGFQVQDADADPNIDDWSASPGYDEYHGEDEYAG